MHSKVLLIIASAFLAVASPVGKRQACTPRPPTPPGASTPVLPVNGGSRELALPPTNATLKAIILGFGIQNYTCTSETEAPKAAGALAMLYDITRLYPGQAPDSLSAEDFESLTATAIRNHDVPLNFESTEAAPRGASVSNPFPAASPLELDGFAPIPFAGHHLFNGAGQPQFVLESQGMNLLAAKNDGIDAPATADRGPDDTGAVQWLLLDTLPGSAGATHIYRLLTAGGASHGCGAGAGTDSVSYTATYWFYG
jgi:hypothetical protein